MVYDWRNSGRSLEECEDLIRRESEHSGEYSVETVWVALESLRDSPEDMVKYFETVVGVVKTALKKKIDNGSEGSIYAGLVANGNSSLDDMARQLARSQLVHVIGSYLGSEVPRKWNSAVPDLEIPPCFL